MNPQLPDFQRAFSHDPRAVSHELPFIDVGVPGFSQIGSPQYTDPSGHVQVALVLLINFNRPRWSGRRRRSE